MTTILKLGPVTITFLGLAVAIGFILGSFLVWREGKEENFNEEEIMDAILLVSLSSFVSSRLFYVFLLWDKAGVNLASLFDFVNQPGFSWLGAFLGGIISLVFFCRQHKWDFFKTADFSSLGVVWLAIFVDLGNLLDKNFLLGHKWQWGPFLELILMVIFLKLLYYFDKHYRTFEWYKNKRGEAAPGFLFLSLIIFFSLTKFIVAFFYSRDLYWILGQILSLGVFFTGLGLLYSRSAKITNLSFFNKLKETKKNRFKIKTRNKKEKKFHYKKGVEAK